MSVSRQNMNNYYPISNPNYPIRRGFNADSISDAQFNNQNNVFYKNPNIYARPSVLTQQEEIDNDDFTNRKHMDSLDLFAKDIQNITKKPATKNRNIPNRGSGPIPIIPMNSNNNNNNNNNNNHPNYNGMQRSAANFQSFAPATQKQNYNNSVINDQLYDELQKLEKSRGEEYPPNSRGGGVSRNAGAFLNQSYSNNNYPVSFNVKREPIPPPLAPMLEQKRQSRAQSYNSNQAPQRQDLREFQKNLLDDRQYEGQGYNNYPQSNPAYPPQYMMMPPEYNRPMKTELEEKIAEQNRLLMNILNTQNNPGFSQSQHLPARRSENNFMNDISFQYALDQRIHNLEKEFEIKNEIRNLRNELVLNNQKHELEKQMLQMNISNNKSFLQMSSQIKNKNHEPISNQPSSYFYPYSGWQDKSKEDQELDELLKEFLKKKDQQKRRRQQQDPPPTNNNRQQQQQSQRKSKPPPLISPNEQNKNKKNNEPIEDEDQDSPEPFEQKKKNSTKRNTIKQATTSEDLGQDDPQQNQPEEPNKPWFPLNSQKNDNKKKKKNWRTIRIFLRHIRVLGAANLLLRHYQKRQKKRRIELIAAFNENFKSKAISGLEWLLLSCRKLFSVLSQNAKQDLDIVNVGGVSEKVLDEKYSGIIILSQFLVDSLYDYSCLPDQFPIQIQQFLITYFMDRSFLPNDFLTVFQINRLRFHQKFYYLAGAEREGSQMLIGSLLFIRMLCAAILTKPWDFSSQKIIIPDTPVIRNKMKSIASILYWSLLDLVVQKLPIIDNQYYLAIPDEFQVQPLQETIALNFDARAQTPSSANTADAIVSGLFSKMELQDFYQQKAQWVRDLQTQMDQILDNLFDILVDTRQQQYVQEKQQLVEVAEEELKCNITKNLRDQNYPFVQLEGGPLEKPTPQTVPPSRNSTILNSTRTKNTQI